MAKRRRLEAPGAAELADIEAGFVTAPMPDRIGLSAPISQVAAEAAALAQPLATQARVAMAQDASDAGAWRHAVQEGRVLLDLPLQAIDTEHLIRDRLIVDAAEMEELKTSILAHGLRLPVEVVGLPGGRYGLVSGWRRVTVLQELAREQGAAFGTVKAILRAPYEAGAIYTAMVEENEIRAQLTPYERGRIAVVAARQGAFSSTEAAVDAIFAAASKAKRSKIRSFALVHDELGDMLQNPTDLSERNGLQLAHALREGFGAELRMALIRAQGGGAAQEWAAMETVVALAEATEREPSRGGRPKLQLTKPSGQLRALAQGVTMERVLHEDGYSVRLRGKQVDVQMIEQVMDAIRHLLSRP